MNKQVQVSLCGINGNADALILVFATAARAQGWTRAEVDEVFGMLPDVTERTFLNTLDILLPYISDNEVEVAA